MEVHFNQESTWEVDEEKIFTLYEEEWNEWKRYNGDDLRAREGFAKDVLWELAPHFEEIGGVEIFDDARIDIFFTEGVK
jgi:hypothetical protein